jgi:ArsR family transcriptional regulator
MKPDVIYKAIASPLRRQILGWLKAPEEYFVQQDYPFHFGVCVTTLNKLVGRSQSTVSAHIAILQAADLLTSKRLGQCVFLKRNEVVINAFLRHVQSDL